MSQWNSAPNGVGRKRSPSASRLTWGPAAAPRRSARPSQGRACSRLVPLGLLPRQCRLRCLFALGASPTSALSAFSDAWADDDGRSPAAPAPPPPSRPSPMPGPTPTPVRPRRRFRLRSFGPLRRQCHLRRQFARGACPATTCPDMTRERSEQHQHAEGSPRSRRTRPDAAAWRRLSTSRLCLRCGRRSGGRQTELWRSLLGAVPGPVEPEPEPEPEPVVLVGVAVAVAVTGAGVGRVPPRASCRPRAPRPSSR